jgi:hypothetical protein
MDLMEITEKERLSREDAAARLHALADALARHNEVEFERGGLRPQCREATNEIEPASTSKEIPRLDGSRNKSNSEVDQENRRERHVDDEDQLLHLITDRQQQ